MQPNRMLAGLLAATVLATPVRAESLGSAIGGLFGGGKPATEGTAKRQLALDTAKWAESITTLKSQLDALKCTIEKVKDLPVLREYRTVMGLYSDVQLLLWQVENFTPLSPSEMDALALANDRYTTLENNIARVEQISRVAESAGRQAGMLGGASAELQLMTGQACGPTAAIQGLSQQIAVTSAQLQGLTNVQLAMLQVQMQQEQRQLTDEARKLASKARWCRAMRDNPHFSGRGCEGIN